MRSFSMPKVAISLALALLAAVILIGINETGYNQSTQALDSIAEATRTRASLNRVLQHVLDAETGSRGYLLTGDPRYLEPYNAAVAEIGQQLDALRLVYTPSADEFTTLAQLTRNVQRKLAEMDLSVRMRKQGNEDAWKFVLMTDVGKEHMDAIRAEASKLINSATHRMEVSQEQVRRSLLLARIGIATVAMAGLLAFYLYLRQTTALKLAGEQQQRVLQQERDLLERQVRERTATLAELATHLQNVREEERGHLARELHDELGALLTAAKLDVARLKSRLATQPPEIGQRLQHLTEALNSGIALKRRIIEDLRPSSLSNLGLTASLEILARRILRTLRHRDRDGPRTGGPRRGAPAHRLPAGAGVAHERRQVRRGQAGRNQRARLREPRRSGHPRRRQGLRRGRHPAVDARAGGHAPPRGSGWRPPYRGLRARERHAHCGGVAQDTAPAPALASLLRLSACALPETPPRASAASYNGPSPLPTASQARR